MGLLGVTVAEAELKVSEGTGKPYVGLILQLRDDYLFLSEKVGCIYCEVSNSPDWASSFGRAHLRVSLGLGPVVLEEGVFSGVSFLTVPLMTGAEMLEILGRELRAEVIVQDYPGGEGSKRLRVVGYLPK